MQLRNRCLDLLGLLVIYTTQPMKSTSRAFARESQKKSGLSFEEILEFFEKRNLGIK